MNEENEKEQRYPSNILDPDFDMSSYRTELLKEHEKAMQDRAQGLPTWHITPAVYDMYSEEYDVDQDIADRVATAKGDKRIQELKASLQAIIEQAHEMKDQAGQAIILEPDVAITVAPYSRLPNAIPLHHLSEIMNSGGTIRNAAGWQQGETEQEWSFIVEKRNEIITIHFSNITFFFQGDKTNDKLTSSMRGVKKIWRYLLTQLMKQSPHGKIPDEIVIDLNEMVSPLGMYSTPDNAWRALVDALRRLSTVDINRKFKGKKPKEYGGTLFYHRAREGYIAKVSVNKNFGFEYYRREYTYSPRWIFRLNDAAFTLADYVFYLMRQNSTQLAEKSSFIMRLESVHRYMGLKTPEEISTDFGSRHTQFIKKPIYTAIKEINEAAQNDQEINGHFKLTLHEPKTRSIQQWLAESYIVVTADGEYTKHFIPIAETQKLYTDTYATAKEKAKETRTKKAATRKAKKDAKKE